MIVPPILMGMFVALVEGVFNGAGSGLSSLIDLIGYVADPVFPQQKDRFTLTWIENSWVVTLIYLSTVGGLVYLATRSLVALFSPYLGPSALPVSVVLGVLAFLGFVTRRFMVFPIVSGVVISIVGVFAYFLLYPVLGFAAFKISAIISAGIWLTVVIAYAIRKQT